MRMTTDTQGYAVRDIDASAIVAGDNDRRHFDAAALDELAEGIRSNGLLAPPTVRPIADGRYEIVAGERRTRAMRDVLGWTSIPCIVRDMDDRAASDAMLVENMARADLDPAEQARAFGKRRREGRTLEEIASTAGVSVATVRARLALLELSDVSLHLVSRGGLPIGHAVMMAGLDANRQILATKAYDAQRLDAVGFGALCDRLLMEQNQDSMFDAATFMRAEEYAADAVAAAREAKGLDLADELERLRRRVRALEAADVDVLLGVQEISRMVGVQERTVHQWQHRGRLPARDATVSGLPAWRRSTIVDWAASTGREVMRSA